MHKILMVDDEPDLDILIQQRFRSDIRSGNLLFYFARNGKKALELLAEHGDTSVVISDLNMPEMNGLELLAAIRERYPNVKTLILSAYSDDDSRSAALEEGAADFITKPIVFSVLEEKLRNLLSLVS